MEYLGPSITLIGVLLLAKDRLMLVWKVRVEGRNCLHELYSEAKEDLRSHDSGVLYPKVISKVRWQNIPDFTGW